MGHNSPFATKSERREILPEEYKHPRPRPRPRIRTSNSPPDTSGRHYPQLRPQRQRANDIPVENLHPTKSIDQTQLFHSTTETDAQSRADQGRPKQTKADQSRPKQTKASPQSAKPPSDMPATHSHRPQTPFPQPQTTIYTQPRQTSRTFPQSPSCCQSECNQRR